MAQADTDEITEGVEIDEPEEELEEVEQTDDNADEGTEEPDDVVISIGEESPPSDEDTQQDTGLVRRLRETIKAKTKREQELEQEVRSYKQPTKAVELGPKPTLESCEYDTDAFESKLEQWYDRKRQADAEQAEKARAVEAQNKAWQAQVERHNKLKSELKVRDFEDAEAAVEEALSVTQRGLIVHAADDSAKVVYALGTSPKHLKELAAIEDPVKFVAAFVKLETQLKVTPRKTAPLPEKTPRGSAPVNGKSDSKLARLEAEADKSGDRSALIAYRRSLNAKGK